MCVYRWVFSRDSAIVKYHDMNRVTLIEQIEKTRMVLEKLLILLQSRPSSAIDLFPTSVNPEENIDEPVKLPGKQIERCVIASFRFAESMGFKGEFRQSRDLLRIGD